ncbi:hypothetical protein A33M_3953 [Rhodovulum sp. PH10]|uniref:hypothetical protein n=1 Tax=Rhodovulum sp. PH10 TaxID=1187851 RepID=UPI00027C2220|nr:hypothetical protein [Rhodovulum sp. PH10]EJW10884.1 hypothetical protein A33M_3953 [Rhodovulum sp. PH10]
MHQPMRPSGPLTSGRQIDAAQAGLGIGVAVLGVGIAALLARGTRPAPRPDAPLPATRDALHHAADLVAGSWHRSPSEVATTRAGRRLNRAAGLLAFSVLADSAIEHYRGSFANKAMFTPLVVSTATLATSLHGLRDRSAGAHRLRDGVYLTAAVTGLVGTGFHLYNVLKRPGRLDWQNLFYGAPLGAPNAIMLSGLLGAVAERVRDTEPGRRPRVLGIPAGRMMAAVTAIGLIGTMGEAALLHFRGAYHNPFMVLPVTLPPVAAVLMAREAIGPKRENRRFARWWLRLTAAMGFAGSGFHVYGVSRNMGGWRNWRQTVLDGPPIPAPPSFTGLALAGLGALALLEDHPDA